MSPDVLEGKIPAASPEEKEAASTYQTLLWMVSAEKEKLRLAQQATSVELANQVAMRGEMERKQGEQTYQLKVERDQHLHGMEQEKGALKDRKNQLDALAAELDVRKREIEALERQGEPLRALQRTVMDKRVEAEKIRLNALAVAEQAQQLLDEANAKTQELNVLRASYTQDKLALDRKTVDVNGRESALADHAAKTQADVDRLTQLQTDLAPRLEELTRQKSEAEAQALRGETLLKEAAQQLAEANQLKADAGKLIEQANAKADALIAFQQQLEQTRLELQAKIAQANLPNPPILPAMPV